MKKTITINGDVYTYGRFEPVYNYKRDIYNLYDRPSYEKIQAFEEWNKKLVEIYGLVGSKFAFSIYGYVRDEEGHLHNVKITRDYNWILD
jgi:membrane-bound lytic murein transglycosylase